jgi:hypothetical protein
MSNLYGEDKYGWITGLGIGFAFLVIITLVILCFIKFAKWEPKYRVPPSVERSTAWKEFNSKS